MLLAAKLALGPVLARQARVVRRTALRLPEAPGPREGIAGAGDATMRLLVVGDSAAAGVGLDDQSRALAQPLATMLAQRLGGAVSWRLLARTGVNTAQARELLAKSPVTEVDVVVTALGVNDVSSQVSAGAFITQTAQLWADLRQRTALRWGVVCGLPPMGLLTAIPQPLRWYLGRYAASLDAAARTWSQRERLGFCPLGWTDDASLLASDGFHPGAALYPQWAQRLADLITQGRGLWSGTR